jgi:phosphohistidine phosphatase
MPRRLIVMRHAKSSWDKGVASDHARPLNARGQKNAPRMARELLERGWVPDHVVSSDAVRTRETWAAMEPVFGESIDVQFERGLYCAGLGELQGSAEEWSNDWNTVLTLGHNPGWSHAASVLSSSQVEMTTANCVLLESAALTWTDALSGPWTLVELLRPRPPR